MGAKIEAADLAAFPDLEHVEQPSAAAARATAAGPGREGRKRRIDIGHGLPCA